MTTLAGVPIRVISFRAVPVASFEIKPRAGAGGKVFHLGAEEFSLELTCHLIEDGISHIDDLIHNFLSAMESARVNGTTVTLTGLKWYLDGDYYVESCPTEHESVMPFATINLTLLRSDYPAG